MAKQGGQTPGTCRQLLKWQNFQKAQRLRLKLLQNANETNYMIRDKKMQLIVSCIFMSVSKINDVG